MGKFIFLAVSFLFLSLVYSNANAQSPATGCLLSNNIIYEDTYFLTSIYDLTGDFKTLSINRCSWIPSGATSLCQVAASRTFSLGCFCYTYSGVQTGARANFNASSVVCPVDGQVLILPIGILGASYLRKRRLTCY